MLACRNCGSSELLNKVGLRSTTGDAMRPAALGQFTAYIGHVRPFTTLATVSAKKKKEKKKL